MGLADLGGMILRAFDKMSNETVIDKEVRKRCLYEITRAFVQSIIEPKLIRDMRAKIKNILINHLNLDDLDAARKMIQQVVFDGLCKLLDHNPSFHPKLGKTSVIMFVGAQGCGKTTTCAQYANYYQKKGLKTGLVCADTFRNGAFDQLKQNATKANIPFYDSFDLDTTRNIKKLKMEGITMESDHVKIAKEGEMPLMESGLVCADAFRNGAFDQLKQNATKANIPCYGSYTELDHVKIAVKGVERCKEENCDLIIVDASGGHKQEDALFEEMHQISKKPDLVILVTDGNIGQDGFDNDSHKQAMAFAQSVDIGAVILTKMDGHAMGGGSLSAVAAAKSPVIFIGTEHMDEFDVFEVKSFVSCLLGMDDWYEFIDKVYEVPELPQNLPERKVWIPPLAYFPPSLHHLFDSD